MLKELLDKLCLKPDPLPQRGACAFSQEEIDAAPDVVVCELDEDE